MLNWTDIIGTNGSLASALARASVLADCEASFSLFGERGSGKETLARAIATASERGAEPFVKLRCDAPYFRSWSGALKSDFASASAALVGRGVLYIAEVDALPQWAQRTLTKLVRSDALSCRVAFGTSRSFLDARSAGLFLPEFEALLASYPLALPALRERGEEEWSALADRFFAASARSLGVWPRPLTEPERTALRALDYPENLDDLQRRLDALALVGTVPKDDRTTESTAPESPTELDAPSAPEDFPTLDEAARRHIEAALTLCRGAVDGKRGAATLLDINPYTLRARMRKLGIDWKQFRVDDSL